MRRLEISGIDHNAVKCSTSDANASFWRAPAYYRDWREFRIEIVKHYIQCRSRLLGSTTTSQAAG